MKKIFVSSYSCTEQLNLKNISYWHYFITKIMSICPIWNFTLYHLCHTKSSFFWKSPSCQLIKTHISNSNKHRQFVVLIIIIINICIFWRKCMKNHTLWLCPLPNDEEDGVHVGNDWGADFGDKPAISSSQFSSSYMMTRKYQQLTQIINKN